MEKVRILFVCMGNICRSPTAEGVFRHRVQQAGLAGRVEIDSAGTVGYHAGEPPDRRAVKCADARGYDLSALRARQVRRSDFADFDYVMVVDQANLEALRSRCPLEYQSKLRLLMEFARRHSAREVPDPYYSGAKGFEAVLDMIEDAADGLLDEVRRELTSRRAESSA